jgi:hypothetical protein
MTVQVYNSTTCFHLLSKVVVVYVVLCAFICVVCTL